MKINKGLLAIKGHYFLRLAGTAYICLMLPLIVRSKGLSAQAVGMLWTVLPVVGLITSSICGTLADYFKAHRAVFLTSLVFLSSGITSLNLIPELPFAAQALEEASSGVSLENATLHLSALTSGNDSPLDVGSMTLDPEMAVGEGHVPPQPLEKSEMAAENEGIAVLFQYPQFWLVFFALMAQQMGISMCVMISDAVCFQILGSERHKYGQQRLWGTIGAGVMAVVFGALVDIYSQGLPQKDYLPAVIGSFVLLLVDLVVVARMKIPYTDGDKLVLGNVGSSLLNPQVLLSLVTVFVMGFSLGVVWVFKLMMVEDVALAWNPDFAVLKLLQGLVVSIETFLGELPFFFLSGMIIERLGYTLVLSSSLVSLGLQCCLYYTVTNPWWFLPIEILNGPSYSLFHSAMASYASHIAPPGAQATLQGIVRATFSTGLSTAGLLGGILYNTMGSSVAFLQVGIAVLTYVLVSSLLHLIIRYFSHRKAGGEVSFLTGQCKDKMEPFSDKSPEAVKELLLEKECGGPVAKSDKKAGEECVKFMV